MLDLGGGSTWRRDRDGIAAVRYPGVDDTKWSLAIEWLLRLEASGG